MQKPRVGLEVYINDTFHSVIAERKRKKNDKLWEKGELEGMK